MGDVILGIDFRRRRRDPLTEAIEAAILALPQSFAREANTHRGPSDNHREEYASMDEPA